MSGHVCEREGQELNFSQVEYRRTIQTLVEFHFLVFSTSIDKVVNSHKQPLERVRGVVDVRRLIR